MKMEKSEIFKHVVIRIKSYFPYLESEKVTNESSLEEDLGLDSLDRIEVIMSIEEHFSIQIEDDDAEKFIDVGNIVDFLDKKINS